MAVWIALAGVVAWVGALTVLFVRAQRELQARLEADTRRRQSRVARVAALLAQGDTPHSGRERLRARLAAAQRRSG